VINNGSKNTARYPAELIKQVFMINN